jgi:molybdenum storage protein
VTVADPDRKVIASALSGSTLTGTGIGGIEYDAVAVMPDVRVVKIGGQSIMDRGRAALFPILDEIVACRKQGIQILVMAGGGTRARHIYSIASELELPTGVLAKLGGYIPVQNARMLQMLLAKHGGTFITVDDFEKLPLYMQMGCIPIMNGMPPFAYWEKRSDEGRIPQHRTDAGVFLSAEFLGSKRAIFIKDEDGMYTDDPKKNPQAELLRRVSAAELQKLDLPDLIVERVCIDYLPRARWCREIQVVNGLRPGEVTKALHGEDAGTIITA